MNLDIAFPSPKFTTAEMTELAKHLTSPSVIKYFKDQQISTFKAIANGLPKEGESDAEYLRRQATVVGQLTVWEILLSIEKPTEPGSPES